MALSVLAVGLVIACNCFWKMSLAICKAHGSSIIVQSSIWCAWLCVSILTYQCGLHESASVEIASGLLW